MAATTQKRAPNRNPWSSPTQHKPAHVPLRADKTGDEVFVFAFLDAQESATVPRAPRPVVAVAVADRQRAMETL
jgi:hypothetical protein